MQVYPTLPESGGFGLRDLHMIAAHVIHKHLYNVFVDHHHDLFGKNMLNVM